MTVPKLTHKLLPVYEKQIPFEVLSRTFADAISGSRRLGIEYIWINSLCIIQDDPADWAVEAAELSSVYSGASITIAAMASADGTGGCFKQRESGEEVRLETSAGLQCNMMLAFERNHDFDRFGETLYSSHSVPLARRKWFFQERMMSRRLVYYTAHELFWECNTEVTCECGKTNGSSNSKISSQLKHDLPGYRLEDRMEYWKELVTMYSCMSLTFDSDTLPAFSAIARRFCDCGGGQYIAGLWRQALPYQLCWHKDSDELRFRKELSGERCKTRRVSQYGMPSWSWASVRGPVEFEIISFDRYDSGFNKYDPSCWDMRIVDVACEVDTFNEFGAVSKGELEIDARGVETRIVERLRIDKEETEERFTFSHGGTEGDGRHSISIDVEDDYSDLLDAYVWLVLLRRVGDSGTRELESHGGWYLLFRETEDARFRRIGFWRAPGHYAITEAVKASGRREFTIV